MAGRFLVRHFCGSSLYGKMVAYKYVEDEGLLLFWVFHLVC